MHPARAVVAVLLCALVSMGEVARASLPVSVGSFPQPVHTPFTERDGLPSYDVLGLGLRADGIVVARTADGDAWFDGEQWQPLEAYPAEANGPELDTARTESLHATVRDTAMHDGERAAACEEGLYVYATEGWRMVLPRDGNTRWAPVDVRAAAYDKDGRLWFAAPQGVGCRMAEGEWRLFTGDEGLPYNDFTCMAAGPSGVWFGTTNGAIHYRDGQLHFRQGRRWLLDNHVRDIAVDAEGNAWLATAAGVSCIAHTPMTLAEKARYFEEEIEKYNRRTEYGYVTRARLQVPGDRSTAVPVFTDNDGHFNGLYLAAMSFAYDVTGDEQYAQHAHDTFRALAFLSEVTEGGTHPAPKGFIARTVVPTSEPDPNPGFDLEYDQRRNARDAMWKIIQPRWPIDETGEWYWKNDSSSDELAGHFFGYAVYFDRVCETEEEKGAVRAVVRRIVDHILDHGYNLVDHDGKPTRWARFSPEELNEDPAWSDERGLNSYHILAYLLIAHHITGDARYRAEYEKLAFDHGYGMNGMTHYKTINNPGFIGHAPDDNMAFMNYYHLIRYETDPKLLSMYYYAIYHHWQHEKRERNPFFNFIYAATCEGKTRVDQWGPQDISPPPRAYTDAVDTLKRYPLDLIDWPMSNLHRTDLTHFTDEEGNPSGKGGNHEGEVYPIDERHETLWDLDPWVLEHNADGTTLRDGWPYLIAYYMGRAHGFIS